MTSRNKLKQRQPVDHSDVEPLPDPHREPDMNRRRRIRAFDGILVPYFVGRGDVLVSGEGYLRHDASNDSEQLAPDYMVASSSAGFFSSTTPSGMPLMNSTMSARRVLWFSVTVNWLTASQSLLSGVSKSISRTCAPLIVPSSARYSMMTPCTSIR